MLAANYITVKNNFKDYCDKAINENEKIIVNMEGNNQDLILLSLDEYNNLMKAIRNAQYLEKIDTAIEQLKQGKGTEHELIEV